MKKEKNMKKPYPLNQLVMAEITASNTNEEKISCAISVEGLKIPFEIKSAEFNHLIEQGFFTKNIDGSAKASLITTNNLIID